LTAVGAFKPEAFGFSVIYFWSSSGTEPGAYASDSSGASLDAAAVF